MIMIVASSTTLPTFEALRTRVNDEPDAEVRTRHLGLWTLAGLAASPQWTVGEWVRISQQKPDTLQLMSQKIAEPQRRILALRLRGSA